jgi:hypothetical protein
MIHLGVELWLVLLVMALAIVVAVILSRHGS